MGSFFAALIPALLSTAPSAAVVLSRRMAVAPAEAAAVASQVTALLSQAGAPLLEATETNRRLGRLGLKDATTCSGKPACAAEVGKQLKVDWLVLVNLSRVAGDRSLALELFEVSSRTVVDSESLLLPKGTELTGELLAALGARLKARLAPAPPPAETAAVQPALDAPLAPALTPEPRVSELPPPLPPAQPQGHVASWVLGGVGVAALGAAVALFVSGANAQSLVNAGEPGPDGRIRSPLTGSQAQAQASAASVQLGLGAAAAAVGAGLGATAVVLW